MEVLKENSRETFSRRDVLKIYGLMPVLLTGLPPINEESKMKSSNYIVSTGSQKGETLFTACIICGQLCPIRVDKTPNRLLKVTYNYDAATAERYACCARPTLIYEMSKHPDRILGPMIRVGERGLGEFRMVSWEEAMDYVAENLRKYMDRPEEIVVFSHQGYEAGLIGTFFRSIIGTPNVTNHADTCHIGADVGRWFVFGSHIGPGGLYSDYIHAQFIVLMGRDPLNGIVSAPWGKAISIGNSNNAKIIVFDVKRPRIADIADEVHILAPGTDLAVVLAITNVILNEKLYDSSYLIKFTNASMLIYADSFEPVKLEDHPSWEKKKTYLVVDSDGKFKLETDAANPKLEFSGEYEGRPIKTVLSLLAESVKNYTPEWAEKISGVRKEKIVETARLLASFAPRAFIDHGYKGTRYRNESMFYRVSSIVNTLIGSFGSKGGIAWPRKASIPSPLTLLDVKPVKPTATSIYEYWSKLSPDEGGHPLAKSGNISMLFIRSILEDRPYPIKAAVIYNQNLIAHIQGSYAVEKALRKLEFVVLLDTMWNETAAFADIILPLPFFFEYTPLTLVQVSKTNTAQIAYVQKVVDPPAGVDVRPPGWIVFELVKRLKPELSDAFKPFVEDPEQIHRKQAEKMKIDFEKLKTHGVLSLHKEPSYKVPLPLATVTGKIELINIAALTRFKKFINTDSLLNPLPRWIPPYYMEGGALGPDEFVPIDAFHPLTATNMWIRQSRIASSVLKWERMDGVYINRERGVKLGLKDNDMIIIENPETKVKIGAKVYLSDDTHPYALYGVHALNPGDYEKGTVKMHMIKTGINSNFILPFKVVEYEGRAAQCDGIVRIMKR